MDWPAFFPEKCPPPSALDASGEVFRLVSKNLPQPSDFRCYRELYPSRDFGEKLCQACGLSIFLDKSDVDRLRRRVPATRKKLLASGQLISAFGKILPTPHGASRSHHTWWLPSGIDLQNVCDTFSVIENGAES